MNKKDIFFKAFYQKSYFLNSLTVAIMYTLMIYSVLSYFSNNGAVSVIWPCSGLGLAALLLGGWSYGLAIFIGAFTGYYLAGNAFNMSVLMSIVNSLEVGLGFLMLSMRQYRFNCAMNQTHSCVQLMLTGMVSVTVSAVIGNSIFLAYEFIKVENFMTNLIDWWTGHFLGMMLIAPLILIWRQLPLDWFKGQRRYETIIGFSLAFLFGQAILLDSFYSITGRILGYWMFLFIVWAAVRYGRHGVLLLLSMIVIQGLLGALQHKGLFATGLINFTSYVLVLMAVSMGLHLNISKREESEQALRLSESHLLAAQRIAGLGSWQWYCEQDKFYVSQEIYRMFSIENSEQTINDYASFIEYIYPEDRQQVIDTINKALCHAHPYQLDYRILLANGELRFIHAQAEVLTDSTGELLMIGTAQNITAQKQAQEAMRLAALVYENRSEAMMITDERDLIIATNPAFTVLTGFNGEEVIGKNPKLRKSGHQDDSFYDAMYAELNNTGKWQGEVWNLCKSGEIHAEWLSINTIFNDNGTVYRRVALFYDITEKKANEVLIWKQANFDPLTELANRHMFIELLEQTIKKAQQLEQRFTLLFLDLDHFKEINNNFGHSLGDALLKKVTQRLQSYIESSDNLARFGGDEFSIILHQQPAQISIETFVKKILDSLNQAFFIDNKTLYISASVGITTYPSDGNSAEILMKNADRAMYAAKGLGRNGYSYFTAEMELAARMRMQLTTDLHHVVKQQQLLIYYQPIVTLNTLSIDKAEALIRWQHPSRGLISPAEFIPIAEETGVIIEIGEWIFRQVSKQVKQWRQTHHPDFQISINKSPVQFYNKTNLYPSWPEQLAALELSGHSIVVEITEGMLLDATNTIQNTINAFHQANIQVSLDDFGTGYSSLAYLKKFDIDYLKIDQCFVRHLTAGSDDMALCEAIIVMSHKLGIKVIAEGIETQEQLQLLIEAGCDYGQGYLFSKPIPAAEFEQLLKADYQISF